MKERKVLTTGTFDLLHVGHTRLLEKACKLGTSLTVGLNRNPSGKTPLRSAEERKEILESLIWVDEVVILDSQEDKFRLLESGHFDIFAIGEEYRGYPDMDEISKYVSQVCYIPRTEGVSSTDTRKRELDQYEFRSFCIDIDDTLLTTVDRDFEHSIPHRDVIDKVNRLHSNGWGIILCTARGAKSCTTLEAREAKYRKVTEDWLKANGVQYDALVFGKPNADFYVDDKSMSIRSFLDF